MPYAITRVLMECGTDQLFDINGLQICCRIFGDPSLQNPVIYFHGLPGSRLEVALADSAARARGISIVAFDRPGIGRSHYVRRTAPGDCVPLVKEVARRLGLRTFKILAVSGGTPYALAAAQALPDAVRAVAVVSGTAPFPTFSSTAGMLLSNRFLIETARWFPPAARLQLRLMTYLLRAWPALGPWMVGRSSRADGVTLSSARIFALMKDNAHESVSGDPRAIGDEVAILSKPWGFAFDFQCPVALYYGDHDTIVPPSAGERLKQLLPNANLQIVPGEGHMLIVNCFTEVLDLLGGEQGKVLGSTALTT